MQNIFKRILSCGMALLMCLGITTVVHSTVTENYSIVADAATDYYADITATKGTQLLGQLHDLIVKTHKDYTSYEDCKTYGPKTDPGPNGGALEFYTHESIKTFKGDAGTWNREHVWCQSLSGKPQLWGTSNAGSDMHHIRPSEARLNGTRGSKKYGKVTNGEEAYSKTTSGANSKLGGHVGGGVFEPLDNVKGDAARIVMYVYTHYNTASNVGGTVNSRGSGTLKFNYVMAPSSESDAIKLLLEWNKLDPVDEIERFRNEEVYKVQGNRNPFIDNSSYADAIWGGGTVTEPDTPVEKAKLTVTPSSLSLKVGETQKLSVSFNPASAASSVTWNSDNPSVASVSATGTVTAKAEGTAKIYATSTSDTSVKNYATVTVTKDGGGTVNPPLPTNSVNITIESFLDTSSYGFHTWQEGDIEGTAFLMNGGSMQFNSSKSSYYLASTKASQSAITSVTVKLNSTTPKTSKNWKLLTSGTPYGEVKGKPADGTDRGTKAVTADGVTWNVSGSDKYFALTYEDTGVCYLDSVAVSFGGSGGGNEPVTPPAVELEGIEIIPSTVALSVGQTKTLTVLCDPLNAKADVNWTTSNSSVATVSNGVVTAKGEGTATITATDKNNSTITSTATVTVSKGDVKPSNTATVTLASFTLTDGYGFKQWSQNGFGGIGYIYGGDVRYPENAPTNIQLNRKNQPSYYLASNVSAGNIKSVTVKGIAGSSSRECSLLTSNTPYGEVAGAPTDGTNQGKKVLSSSGVTWTLDGTDKYFALVMETDTGATKIVSIEIVYEGNGQGGYEPDIDQAKLTAFHTAVTAIDTSEKDLEVFAAKIKTAEDILATLNADEKVEAIEDINALSNAKILYDIAAGQGGGEADKAKVDAFVDAVLSIDDNGTVEEREAQIAAADALLADLNVAEKFEAAEAIDILNEAKVKLEQDKNKGDDPTPPDPPVNTKLVAFHNAVAAIDNNASVEAREEKIAAADAIYATLTANEKEEALEDIQILTAAKTKLEQDKNGGGTEEPDIDEAKLQSFHSAVANIPADGTLEERYTAIVAATEIMETFNAAEAKAAAEDIALLDAAYQKYQQDVGSGGDNPNPPVTETDNVKAFKTALAQIPSSGSLEAKFNALVKAISAYQKLTADEKNTVSIQTALLNSAIAVYNDEVSAYNSSAENASDVAEGSLKVFF